MDDGTKRDARPPAGPERLAAATTQMSHFTSAMFVFLGAMFTTPGGVNAAAMLILGLDGVVRWIRTIRAGLRAAGPMHPAVARRRLLLAPCLVVLGAVATAAYFQMGLVGKNAELVWAYLPEHTANDGRIYNWPGFDAPRFLQRGAVEWGVMGGPYVPQPDESPRDAASRVGDHLRDRFGLYPDLAELEATLRQHRGETDAGPHAGGFALHPYTTGLRAIEAQYLDRTRRVLLLRTSLDLLLILLAGCAAIRLGVARRPAWVESRAFLVGLAVPCVGVMIWQLTATDSEYVAWRLMEPVYRSYVEHAAVASTALLAAALALIVSAWRRAPGNCAA